MSFYPCSADRPDLDEEAQADADVHVCDRGWLGEDDDGRPIPCPICKHDLIQRRRHGGWHPMTGREVWTKRRDESAPAFEAFARYRDMGPRRSLAKVRQEGGKSRSQLERWSTRHRWVMRAEAYDAEQDRLWLIEQRVARREMATKHARLAGALLAKVVERLQNFDVTRLSMRDLAYWLEVGTKLERLALGEPERHTVEHSGPDGGPIEIEHHLSEPDLLAELALIERELRSRVADGDQGPLVALPGGPA